MVSSLRPLNDRILIKRIKAEEKTAGGILIPDNAKEKPQEGIVVAVGSGKILENGNRHPVAVKEGDKVLFGKWSGNEIKLENQEHLIIKEEEILAVLEN